MHEKFVDKASLNREMYAYERLDEEDPIQLVNEYMPISTEDLRYYSLPF